jgi:excisionase family DNA binding protein
VSRRALTLDEACRVYGLSRSTIFRLRRDDGFPAVAIGRHVVIPVAAADAWFAARTKASA